MTQFEKEMLEKAEASAWELYKEVKRRGLKIEELLIQVSELNDDLNSVVYNFYKSAEKAVDAEVKNVDGK